eukprot:tig00020723_g13424.t1
MGAAVYVWQSYLPAAALAGALLEVALALRRRESGLASSERPLFAKAALAMELSISTLMAAAHALIAWLGTVPGIAAVPGPGPQLMLALAWVLGAAASVVAYRERRPLAPLVAAAARGALVLVYVGRWRPDAPAYAALYPAMAAVAHLFFGALPYQELEGASPGRGPASERTPLLPGAGPRAPGEYRDVARAASGLLSRLSFSWVSPLVTVGYSKPLEPDDLFRLFPEDSTAAVAERFEAIWREEAPRGGRALVRALHRFIGRGYYLLGLLKFGAASLGFVGPIVLESLVVFVDDEEAPIWQGYALAFALAGGAGLSMLLNSQYDYRVNRLNLRVRSALATAAYRKSLSIASGERGAFTSGEIINHMSTDVDRVINAFGSFHEFWSLPFQIGVTLYLLAGRLGPPALAGVVVIVVLIPVNRWIAGRIGALSAEMMARRDARGARSVKLLALEPYFRRRIADVREKELAALAGRKYLDAWCVYLWVTTPVFISVSAFAWHTARGGSLTAATVFPALALFQMLVHPINAFPWVVNGLVEANVSRRRVQRLLLARDGAPVPALEAGPGAPAFVARGSLVAVVGPVGSGKSALLAALLGELDPEAPRPGSPPPLARCGGLSVAYVSQEPWIQNATLRANVLFGEPFDAARYSAAIDACGLRPDLATLPAGDLTEIGEKGVNLSGGQRQRVALARAVYADADAYVLDEPVSACDALVATRVFRDAVLGLLGERSPSLLASSRLSLACSKTRVVATHHHLRLLAPARRLLLLQAGRAVQAGTFSELAGDAAGPFAALLAHSDAAVARGADGEAAAPPPAPAPPPPPAGPERPAVPAAARLLRKQPATPASAKRTPRQRLLGAGRAPLGSPSSVAASTPATVASYRTAPEVSTPGPSDSVSRSSEASQGYGSEDGSGEGEEDEFFDARSGGSSSSPPASPPPIQEEAENAASPKNPLADAGAAGALTEDEERRRGALAASSYARYLRAVGLPVAALVALSMTAMQGSRNGTDAWLAYWVARTDGSPAADRYYLSVFAGLAGLNSLVTLARAYSFAVGGMRAARVVHETLLRRVFAAPFAFFEANPVGRIVNRFSADEAVVDDSLPFIANIFIANLWSLAGTLSVLCVATPLFATALLPLAAAYYLIQRRYRRSSREVRRLEGLTRSPIYAHLSETLSGAWTVRAFGAAGRFRRENEALLETHQRANFAGQAVGAWLGFRLQCLGVAVAAAVAFSAVLEHQLSPAGKHPALVGLALAYALPVTGLLSGLVTSFTQLEKEMVSVERVLAYSDVAPEEGIPAGAAPPPPGWPLKGALSFEGLAVQYRGTPAPALRDFSLAVRPGERLGVVGRTGAGKSTLAASLLRAVPPAAGRVAVDGLDVAAVPLPALRSALAILPQGARPGTVGENLDPGGLHGEAALRGALAAVGLASVSPQSEVAEAGSNLSVGERQLVCLARALLRKPRVLVLDEATANVDAGTEARVTAVLGSPALAGTTCLVVAHRLGAVLACDRLLVLDGGRIAELGTPAALLADPSSRLSALQQAAS